MAGIGSTARTSGATPDLLGIYLNDHLAGSTGGLELFRRAARSQRDTPAGAPLARLAADVAADRAALLDLMAALGVRPQRYKRYLAWAAEKAGRLKLNGRLVRRSPLSGVLELEALVMGVEGKDAGWRTLRALAERDDRLDRRRLDELHDRARAQVRTLEELRLQQADEVFATR